MKLRAFHPSYSPYPFRVSLPAYHPYRTESRLHSAFNLRFFRHFRTPYIFCTILYHAGFGLFPFLSIRYTPRTKKQGGEVPISTVPAARLPGGPEGTGLQSEGREPAAKAGHYKATQDAGRKPPLQRPTQGGGVHLRRGYGGFSAVEFWPAAHYSPGDDPGRKTGAKAYVGACQWI